MSFSESGGVITQTGTDTNLSGLSGIAGVTVNGNIYTINSSTRLVIEGTLTIVPEENVLQFEDAGVDPGNPRMEINGSANFTYGNKIIIGSTVTYSRGTGLIFLGSGGSGFNTRTNGAFITRSGNPTITLYGGTIVSGKPISLMGMENESYRGAGTLTIEETVFSMTAGGQIRVDCDETATFNVTNARLLGSSNNSCLVSESFTSFSAVIDHFVLQSFSGQLKGLRFDNLQFKNNQASSDVKFNSGGEVLALVNSDTASSSRRGTSNTNPSHFAFYGQPLIRCLDTNNSPVTTAKYYISDNNDGNRFDPIGDTSSISSLIPPYGALSPTVYSGTVDAQGEASPTILMSTFLPNGNFSDYSNGGSLSDEFDIFIADYNKNLASQSVVLRTPDGTPANFFLLNDSLITETNKAVVDAYTELETSQKFYDRVKAYLVDNYAGETATIVSRSGNTIDAGSYNVTIDATAGSAFAFDGSTITIKASTFTGNITTTGTFTLANGATVIGSVTDVGGTEFSTSIEITNLTSADIYIEDNLGAQFDYQTGVTGTYNNVAPLGSTGTWKVVINRAGYIASVNTFTADGADKSYNGDLVQLTQPSGSPMYTGSTSSVLSVVPATDGSRMNVRIGNGTVTAQQVLDESEAALSTAAGMEYLGNGGGRIEFATLATGTFLFLKDNVRLIRDNAGDSSATVEAFVTSSDGVILDNTNGDVQFVTVTRAQQLIEYDHAIYIDAANGTNSNVYPFGTEANPVDSWSNAKVLADFYGFRHIRFKGTVTLDADAEGYIFEGGGILDTLNISTYSVQGSTFLRMNMAGTGPGFRACETVNLMNGVTNLSGTFALCAFNEQFSIADNQSATFSRCISNLPGLTSPQMNLGVNTQVAIRDYDGSVTVSGSTAGCNTTLDFTSGKATLDNTNTGGTISVRGIARTAFTDNSAGATVDSVGVLENEVMRGTDSAFLAANAPINFSDLVITATTGQVTVGTNNDKTGYSISGTKTTLDTLNDVSAAEVNAEVDTALADYDSPTKAEMDSAFTEIKGATFSATDTLEGIRNAVDTKASQASVDGLNDFDPSTDTLEGAETYDEAFRLMRAEAAGKLAVTGSTVTIRDAADTKDRITATVDTNGQRTSVTTDGS
jgi:hypothetical protein